MALPFLFEPSSILFDLPFSDKKRLVESLISPVSGGKFFVRYLRLNDSLDQGRTELISIVDLCFDLDVDRVGKIISGL